MPTAHDKFEGIMKRARALLKKGRDKPADSIAADNVRMAVVLSVAAMDGYFTKTFCDRFIPSIRNRPKKELIKILENAGVNMETVLEYLFKNQSRPGRSIRASVEQLLKKTSMQRFSMIDERFVLFDIKHFCENAGNIAEKNSNIPKGRGRTKSVIEHVEDLVNCRNEIVHEGHVKNDANPREIDPQKVGRQLIYLECFICGAEELLEKHGKKKSSKSTEEAIESK